MWAGIVVSEVVFGCVGQTEGAFKERGHLRAGQRAHRAIIGVRWRIAASGKALGTNVVDGLLVPLAVVVAEVVVVGVRVTHGGVEQHRHRSARKVPARDYRGVFERTVDVGDRAAVARSSRVLGTRSLRVCAMRNTLEKVIENTEENAVLAAKEARWELYKLLAEPIRLRLIALAAEEELSIGELAEALGESQSNVSRQIKQLTGAGVLASRREGTRSLVRFDNALSQDAVIQDALRSGRRLAEKDGSFARVEDLIAQRDQQTKSFFDQAEVQAPEAEWGVAVGLLSLFVPDRRLAVDVGTGAGQSLMWIAPLFEKVIAVDRSEVQLAQAQEHISAQGFCNVVAECAAYESEGFAARVQSEGGASVVVASRVLHHAPKPQVALSRLAALLAPGGFVLVLDYVAHSDESMREQADLWLGFSAGDLRAMALAVGLKNVRIERLHPNLQGKSLRGQSKDSHLPWQVLIGRKAETN